ncbi:uncharacterized protein G2W53_042730 [Senna tora]|uniref:Uncharacterized protein n=1 Tax=Senna tora TaxID=362788 RepID=A0A834SHE4_9FABA|nr:uncharacterized protein G2W53_042730 [Senna tora]
MYVSGRIVELSLFCSIALGNIGMNDISDEYHEGKDPSSSQDAFDCKPQQQYTSSVLSVSL